MLADLHIHTTFSDGVNTPEQIVLEAEKAHISAIAITDHDNIQGYERAQAFSKSRNDGIEVLRGVEIDTDYKGKDIHVLGYYFDPCCEELSRALAWNRSGRVERVQRIVDKINQLGYPLSFSEVKKEANGARSLGRPHIARVMVKKGYFSTVSAVFDSLIAAGKPAYLRQVKMSPKEASELLHLARGISVLAHPAEIKNPEMVEELISLCHFDGLEVYHPSTLEEKPPHDWAKVAEDHHLLFSGGSDLHGNPGRFPMHLGDFPVDYEKVSGIIHYHR
jgi:predicted metal-dependent phosphoesterase TrpH